MSFSQHKTRDFWQPKMEIQHALIYYSCLYVRAAYNYRFKSCSCVGEQMSDEHLRSVCCDDQPLGCCPFEKESHRTSWWPNDSHFLPNLSPQLLGPRFCYSAAAHTRAVRYYKTSHPWTSVSFCHHKKKQNRHKWHKVRFHCVLCVALPHVMKKENWSKPVGGGGIASLNQCMFF